MDCTLHIAGWIALGIAGFLLIGYLVKMLWNWLLPNIANLKKITYLQALGLLILARLLFGGFGHMGGHGFGGRHWGGHHGTYCSKGKWGGNMDHCERGKMMEKAPEGK